MNHKKQYIYEKEISQDTLLAYSNQNSNQYSNQSMYQHCKEQIQYLNCIPKNSNSKYNFDLKTSHPRNHNKKSHLGNLIKTQFRRVKLGWSNSFTIRQFFSTLQRLYCLVSSSSRMKNYDNKLQVSKQRCSIFHKML